MASSQPCPGCDTFFLPAGTLGCASVAVGSPVVSLGSAVMASCTIRSELCRGLEQGKVQITWMLDNEPVAGSQHQGPGGTEVSNLTLPRFNRTQAKLWCWVEWNGTKQRVGMAEIRAGCKSAAATDHPHVHLTEVQPGTRVHTSAPRNACLPQASQAKPLGREQQPGPMADGRLFRGCAQPCPSAPVPGGQAAGQGRFGEWWRGSGALRSWARRGLRLLHSQNGCFAQALPRPLSPRPTCEALQPQLHPEPQRLRADVPVGARSRQPPPHQRHAEVCRVSLRGDTVPGVWPPATSPGPRPLPNDMASLVLRWRVPLSPPLSLPQEQSPSGDRLHPARRPQPLHSAAPVAPALSANGDLGVRRQRAGHGRVGASLHRPHGCW